MESVHPVSLAIMVIIVINDVQVPARKDKTGLAHHLQLAILTQDSASMVACLVTMVFIAMKLVVSTVMAPAVIRSLEHVRQDAQHIGMV